MDTNPQKLREQFTTEKTGAKDMNDDDAPRVWRGWAWWNSAFDCWIKLSDERLCEGDDTVVCLPAADYDALVEQLAAAKAENERLTGVCNDWGKNYQSWVDGTKKAEAERDTLHAEVERLRAELEEPKEMSWKDATS